jgi:hypothetical protein
MKHQPTLKIGVRRLRQSARSADARCFAPRRVLWVTASRRSQRTANFRLSTPLPAHATGSPRKV